MTHDHQWLNDNSHVDKSIFSIIIIMNGGNKLEYTFTQILNPLMMFTEPENG